MALSVDAVALHKLVSAILADPSILQRHSEALADLSKTASIPTGEPRRVSLGLSRRPKDGSSKKVSLGLSRFPNHNSQEFQFKDKGKPEDIEKIKKYINLFLECDIIELRNEYNDVIQNKTIDNLRILYGIDSNDNYLLDQLRKITSELNQSEEGMAGVTKEGSTLMSVDKSNLTRPALSPIFEGELNRQAMAAALTLIMQQRELSVRKAAAEARVGAKEIQRIIAGEATIDKGLDVLSALGFRVHVRTEPTEPK